MIGLVLLFLTAYLLIALIGSAAIVLMITRPARKTYAHAIARDLPLEPADLGLAGEEVTFNITKQQSTPGWIIQGQNPDGPTVLILHGHRGFTHAAMPFAKTLAPFAAHLVLFDWPAHGGCTAPWMTCGLREPGDALAVLDGLPDDIRERPVVLFGYSLGGQIAVKTVGLYPQRFVGLITDGAYRHWDSPIRLRLKKYRVPSFPFIQITWLVFTTLGLIRNFDRAQFIKQFNQPALLFHGTDDRICPIEEGRQLADAAPNSTFVPIEDGTHNQLHEHDPERYSAALREFFQTIEEPTKAQRHKENQ